MRNPFKRKPVGIPKAAKDLDEILKKCRWRYGNHYEKKDEWELFAKEICGSDDEYTKNPLWVSYIEELVDQKLIKKEPENQHSDKGYIATVKGLMFKGFEQTMIDDEENITSTKLKYILTTSVTIITVCLGATLNHLLSKDPTTPQSDTIVLPKVQIATETIPTLKYIIIHDTVRIPEKQKK